MKVIVITPPGKTKDETVVCNLLFANGLQTLHLRKPGAPLEVYEAFIQRIEPRYRGRIVLHEHYELTERYGLRGIHLRSGQAETHNLYPNLRVSISCHSLDEIKALPFRPAYCFLSPVFDSISKEGYKAAFKEVPRIKDFPFPVVALGGITPERADECRKAGFAGVAVLGYVWEDVTEAVERFIRLRTPYVMSIAGFDPSGGAGVTADLKTFEACGCYGLGACSALTFQDEGLYLDTRWTSLEDIFMQCVLPVQKHQPQYVKIGLIENFSVLDKLLDWLTWELPGVRIVWDPILKASAGQAFHKEEKVNLDKLLDKLYLITPNTEELHSLFGQDVGIDKLQRIAYAHGVNILWKGGHNEGEEATDCLISPKGAERFTLSKSRYGKHGTGCVLSAAIVSRLAQGASLSEACREAQVYVSRFIDSNDSLLGYHSLAASGRDTLPSPRELPLQYITAPKEGMTLCEQAEAVCRGGMRWVQLRMKGASTVEIMRTGKVMKEVCRRYNALFIINDNVDAARQLDADGVHLGKEDMNPAEARELLGSGKIIGATCNTWEDILLRQQQGVDYIGLGPYRFTTTKEKLSPVLGVEGYRNLLQRMAEEGIDIPVFAIGGITEADIPELMQTGIRGIALSGLIKNSKDLSVKTKEVITRINASGLMKLL